MDRFGELHDERESLFDILFRNISRVTQSLSSGSEEQKTLNRVELHLKSTDNHLPSLSQCRFSLMLIEQICLQL